MKRLHTQKGFTIIELAVVIMIVGVLVVIGTVSYAGIQESARHKEVLEEMSQFGRTLVKYKAENGAYPSSTDQLVNNYRVSFTSRLYSTNIPLNLIYCSADPYDDFFLTVVTKSGKRLYVRNSESPVEYTGMTSWTGNAAVTICSSIASGTNNRGPSGWSSGSGWRPWVNIH